MDDRRDAVELRELREEPELDEDDFEEHFTRCFKRSSASARRIIEGGREDTC